MKDPSSANPNSIPTSGPNQNSHNAPLKYPTTSSAMFPSPIRGSHHRRAHSELNFRLSPDDMDLSSSDPLNGSAASVEEIGSEDDLFCTYIDVDKLAGGSRSDECPGGEAASADDAHGGNCADQQGGGRSDGEGEKSARPRHRHSISVDGSRGGDGVFGEVMEAKKAMPPDKLAELWAIDPKRAKRILANRQSAARSKERKTRYILELERKVQTLQTEATTLSAQLTLFQRDTTGLSTENTELKLRLQAMEQQAQLRDALNEALKQEVERLRIATGEITSPSESFSLGMHHIPYTPPTFFPIPQPGPAGHENMQLPPYHHSPSSMSAHHLNGANSHPLSEILHNDPLGQFQGLDISSRGLHIMKSEGSSISASESSSTLD